LELEFPLEFIVEGTPVSLQTARPESRDAWKARVKAASYSALPEMHYATYDRLAATLYYFPAAQVQGDVDNIVKFVLDALSAHIYMDDAQIERVVVQKFEPDRVFAFSAPSQTLTTALTHEKPVLYIRLSDDPFEELK
jgi:crossover junction endodeoxyribonuclease RusA